MVFLAADSSAVSFFRFFADVVDVLVFLVGFAVESSACLFFCPVGAAGAACATGEAGATGATGATGVAGATCGAGS